MTTNWQELTDAESSGFDGDESEAYFDDDAEGFGMEHFDDDAESLQDRRRARTLRARRQLALRKAALAKARQRRMAPSNRGAAPTTKTVVRRVQELDLRNKVQADSFAGALATRDRRIGGTEASLVANAALAKLQTSLGELFPQVAENAVTKVGLSIAPIAPLLLLKPASRGSGLEARVRDPRMLGSALILGLTIAEALKKKSQGVDKVEILGPSKVKKGDSIAFSAVAFKKGIADPEKKPSWGHPVPSGVVTVDETGLVTGGAGIGKAAYLVATVDGVVGTLRVEVTA